MGGGKVDEQHIKRKRKAKSNRKSKKAEQARPRDHVPDGRKGDYLLESSRYTVHVPLTPPIGRHESPGMFLPVSRHMYTVYTVLTTIDYITITHLHERVEVGRNKQQTPRPKK